MKKISIAITTFEKRLALVKNLITSIRSFCDNDIIVMVNADNEKDMSEGYRNDLMQYCASTPACFPTFYPEFKSLPKMWNSAVISSKTEHILLLNDDLNFTNPNAIQAIETIINEHSIDCFRLNYSFSHFVISKTILHTVGYFDERLCGFGEEDGDFVLRYLALYGTPIQDVAIPGINNIGAYDLSTENCETHADNKPRFNREFILLKYKDDPNGLQGMGPNPVTKVMDDYQQYPYEMFVRRNKHNIKTYSNIDLNYDSNYYGNIDDKQHAKELVIATYNRTYDWIDQVNSDVSVKVYTKDLNTLSTNEIVIPNNVGRDVHTFFYHIVNQYDNLADVTFFSQDFGLEHVENYPEIINGDQAVWNAEAKQHFEEYWAYQKGPYEGWQWWNAQHFGGQVLRCDATGLPNHPNLPLKETWDKLFTTQFPEFIEFVPGGHFSITKSQIHIRSKAFYQEVLRILETEYIAPWVFERLEPYIFNSTIKAKELYEHH